MLCPCPTLHVAIHYLQGDTAGLEQSPTLKDLYSLKIIDNVAPDWYSLGITLGLHHCELLTIEADHRHSVRRVQEMFRRWLISSEEATWGKLVEALRSLDMNSEAHRIATLHTPG